MQNRFIDVLTEISDLLKTEQVPEILKSIKYGTDMLEFKSMVSNLNRIIKETQVKDLVKDYTNTLLSLQPNSENPVGKYITAADVIFFIDDTVTVKIKDVSDMVKVSGLIRFIHFDKPEVIEALNKTISLYPITMDPGYYGAETTEECLQDMPEYSKGLKRLYNAVSSANPSNGNEDSSIEETDISEPILTQEHMLKPIKDSFIDESESKEEQQVVESEEQVVETAETDEDPFGNSSDLPNGAEYLTELRRKMDEEKRRRKKQMFDDFRDDLQSQYDDIEKFFTKVTESIQRDFPKGGTSKLTKQVYIDKQADVNSPYVVGSFSDLRNLFEKSPSNPEGLKRLYKAITSIALDIYQMNLLDTGYRAIVFADQNENQVEEIPTSIENLTYCLVVKNSKIINAVNAERLNVAQLTYGMIELAKDNGLYSMAKKSREIVEGIIILFNLYLAHGLNPKFIGSSSTNNPYHVDVTNWYLKDEYLKYNIPSTRTPDMFVNEELKSNLRLLINDVMGTSYPDAVIKYIYTISMEGNKMDGIVNVDGEDVYWIADKKARLVLMFFMGRALVIRSPMDGVLTQHSFTSDTIFHTCRYLHLIRNIGQNHE